jgi:hypothetical protein
MTTVRKGTWVPKKLGGEHPKDWLWEYQGPLPWSNQRGPRGDPTALTAWILEMHAWGQLVATKCRDLEARVKYLEEKLDRRD